jgi:hypothetical protein
MYLIESLKYKFFPVLIPFSPYFNEKSKILPQKHVKNFNLWTGEEEVTIRSRAVAQYSSGSN